MISLFINVLLVMLCIISGCGDMRMPDPIPPAMVGTWSGEASVEIGDDPPRTYALDLTISVDGQVAHLSSICPSGDQPIDVFGFGDHLSTRDENRCAFPATVGGCYLAFVYTSVDVSLDADGTLTVIAFGVSEPAGVSMGCSEPRLLRFVFSGIRSQDV